MYNKYKSKDQNILFKQINAIIIRVNYFLEHF